MIEDDDNLLYPDNIIGTVTLSPSGDSLVCSGDQLNLTCSLTGSNLLEWTFAPDTIFMRPGLYRAIDADVPKFSDDFAVIGSSRFTFSKSSARGNLPLVSTLLIDPVTNDLNGIMINCTDVSSMESATSIVYVVNRHSGMLCWTTVTIIFCCLVNVWNYNCNVHWHLTFMVLV